MKRGQRPRGKFVLVLVEGKSDQIVLERNLSTLYDAYDSSMEVVFLQMVQDGQIGGDITSKNGVNPNNIEKLIDKLFVQPFLAKNGLYPKDICEIIQVVDLDGAYVPDEYVKEKNIESAEYLDYGIFTRNVEAFLERNIHKRDNIDKLISSDKVKIGSKSIPYSLYFFSCNMDHFIDGDRNMNDWYKTTVAKNFAASGLDVFCKKFTESWDAQQGFDNDELWDYMREDLHSLEAHSNIHFLIQKLTAES